MGSGTNIRLMVRSRFVGSACLDFEGMSIEPQSRNKVVVNLPTIIKGLS